MAERLIIYSYNRQLFLVPADQFSREGGKNDRQPTRIVVADIASNSIHKRYRRDLFG